jgi:RNA polymerase sigma-70 factor (ECF subfamily)
MDFLERLSDAELLERTAHEARAFATFYRRHERLILRYLMRCCGEAEQTADLTAETFARALAGAGHFDRERANDAGAAPWLLGIAGATLLASVRRGVVAEHARRRLGCQPLVLDDDAVSRLELRASLPLEKVLETLSPEQRASVASLALDGIELGEEVRLRCSRQLLRGRSLTGIARLSKALALTGTPRARPSRRGLIPMEPVLADLETLLAATAPAVDRRPQLSSPTSSSATFSARSPSYTRSFTVSSETPSSPATSGYGRLR